MSAADELRTASSKLLDLAARAADDTLEEPWLNDGTQITSGAGHWMLVAEVKACTPGETDPVVAEYIATMNPSLGAALANLLYEVAADAQSNDEHDGFPPESVITGYTPALTIARLINGAAS